MTEQNESYVAPPMQEIPEAPPVYQEAPPPPAPEQAAPKEETKTERSAPRMSVIGLRSRLKTVMEQACNTLDTIKDLAAEDEFKGRDGAKVTKQATGMVVSMAVMIPIMKTIGEYMQLNNREVGYIANIMAEVMSRGEE